MFCRPLGIRTLLCSVRNGHPLVIPIMKGNDGVEAPCRTIRRATTSSSVVTQRLARQILCLISPRPCVLSYPTTYC